MITQKVSHMPKWGLEKRGELRRGVATAAHLHTSTRNAPAAERHAVPDGTRAAPVA